MNKTQKQDVNEINDNLNSCVSWNPDPFCDAYHVDTTLDRVYLGLTYNYNYLPKFSSFLCTQCKNTHYLQ